MLSSMFQIFWRWVGLGMRKLVQWRKKCIFDSISLPYLHKGLKLSWKQCLSISSWWWLRPKCNLLKSWNPRRLWLSKKIFTQDRMKFMLYVYVKKFMLFMLSFYSWSQAFSTLSFWNNHLLLLLGEGGWVIAKPGIGNPIKSRY